MSREERRNYWRALVEKHAESDKSATAFCKEHNLRRDQFYSWRRRFRRDACIEQTSQGFLELVPYSKNTQSGIRIVLAGGISIEVDRDFDPPTLRATVHALHVQ